MAYLNVRERRIETKIAYIGPDLAGKTTNLQQLKSDSTRGRSSDVLIEGDSMSLEWRPLRMDRFNDCELAVKLVASRGALSNGRLDDVLVDVDGVVVVVDAAPSSREENQRALDLVREALSRASTPAVPVVVQLNKSDLADAVQVSDVAGGEWPVVRASAARGEGVVETLEMALANVIDAMKRKPATERKATATLAQNPLLAALRDVLRETVTEHMAEVERQAAERIAAAVAAPIDELRARAAELTASIADLSARAKADRDHVTSIGSVLKRSIEGLAAEVRRVDASDKLTKLGAELADLQARVDGVAGALEPTSTAIQRLPNRIAAVEASVQREIREGVLGQLKRIEDSVQVMHVETDESIQRSQKSVVEIQTGLNELLEELKKRKKGWFS